MRTAARPPRPSRASVVSIVASVIVAGLLGGCSGSALEENADLNGCIEGDRGTIALGVTNSAGEPLELTGIEIADAQGVEVLDRFIALDEDARATPARFDEGGRDAFDGVDLDAEAIEPDGAAFVGIEVARTSDAEGRVGGVVITTAGRETTAPVTLVLLDDCD